MPIGVIIIIFCGDFYAVLVEATAVDDEQVGVGGAGEDSQVVAFWELGVFDGEPFGFWVEKWVLWKSKY